MWQVFWKPDEAPVGCDDGAGIGADEGAFVYLKPRSRLLLWWSRVKIGYSDWFLVLGGGKGSGQIHE